MSENNIGGALLIQRADLFYFSGTGQNGQIFIPAKGEPALIVKKSLVRARQDSSLKKIIPFTGWDDLTDLINKALPSSSSIGLEMDILPANHYLRFKQLFNKHSIVDISPAVRQIRAVKSAYEIKRIRDAAKISRSVFNHARKIITVGMSELDLAAQLEAHARSLGHQGAIRLRSFNQELYYGHVLSGENAATVSFFDSPTGGSGLNPSFPQGAGFNPIRQNEPVLIDFVSALNGYVVDQTRIFCLGELPLHLHEAYRQSVHIINELAKAAKPGTICGDLYDKASKLADEAGLSNHFMGYMEKVNFVGHGIGLELDELPVIAPGIETPLQAGMIIAVEPKFIFPGEGTVGIEDTFVVGNRCLQRITEFDDEVQFL